MSLQTCRLLAVWTLIITLFVMVALLFLRLVLFSMPPDSDFWLAVVKFALGIAIPTATYVTANVRIGNFELAEQREAKRSLALTAVVSLVVACLYTLVAAVFLFFVLTKQQSDAIEGLGQVTRTIRYPISEAMNFVCILFAPLITFALSMDVLSMPLFPTSGGNRRK